MEVRSDGGGLWLLYSWSGTGLGAYGPQQGNVKAKLAETVGAIGASSGFEATPQGILTRAKDAL